MCAASIFFCVTELPPDNFADASPAEAPKSFRFTREQRMSHARQFDAVYQAKVRKPVGPLVIFGLPNGTGVTRLGLAVSRRVGNAVMRNRIKRLLREGFRLEQHGLPKGLDLVVSVRAHKPLTLEAYRRFLVTAAGGIASEWERKARRDEARRSETPDDTPVD